MKEERKAKKLKQLAISGITEQEPNLYKISSKIHSTPELGYNEYKASGWLTGYLEKKGFSVEKGICDMPTAFSASYGSGSPGVALLAEYDALPEIGHACGHNLIAVAAIGAASSLKQAIDLCSGTVFVIGTPAPELTIRLLLRRWLLSPWI